MNAFDRFLYKLFIMTLLLLLVVGLDRFNIISLSNIQNEMSENINFLKIIKTLNGKTKIIFIDTEDVSPVSGGLYKVKPIENGRRFILDNFEGVECQALGTVVAIKNNDVYILGTDNITYIYKGLTDVDVNLYQIVKKNEIIGQAGYSDNTYYFDLYCLKNNKYITFE